MRGQWNEIRQTGGRITSMRRIVIACQGLVLVSIMLLVIGLDSIDCWSSFVFLEAKTEQPERFFGVF